MNDKEQQFSALKLSLEFGYTIVIPLVVLAIVGRLLDARFDTSPWFLITGVILSMLVSSLALVMKFKKILGQIEKSADTKTKKDSNDMNKK